MGDCRPSVQLTATRLSSCSLEVGMGLVRRQWTAAGSRSGVPQLSWSVKLWVAETFGLPLDLWVVA